MSIAKTIDNYLRSKNVGHFGLVNHEHSGCMSEAAERSHVSGRLIAKGVVINTDQGPALVVIPATQQVSVPRLRELFGKGVNLAQENELVHLFPDCDVGAVPALGMAYEIPTYVDESLFDHDEVYFEGGDHQSLVELNSKQFESVFSTAERGVFGTQRH